MGTEITGLTNNIAYKVEYGSIALATGSMGTVGDGKITGLAPGSIYKVTADTTVYYVKADGTLSLSFSDAAALTGTEITGLTNGTVYKVEYASVILAGGSLGTAGDGRISGLTPGGMYKVTADTTVYYVKADGTLSLSASDAAALTGSEITGLTNGMVYKVELYYTGGGEPGGHTPEKEKGATIKIGDETQSAGTLKTTTSGGVTTTTVTITAKDLENILDKSAKGATITVPITTGADTAVGRLDGQAVKNMENKEATLVIQTDTATYTLPASEINIDGVSKQLGENVSLEDITVNVTIAEPSDAMVTVTENSAADGGYTIVVPAV
jgi:hypothetical protein